MTCDIVCLLLFLLDFLSHRTLVTFLCDILLRGDENIEFQEVFYE